MNIISWSASWVFLGKSSSAVCSNVWVWDFVHVSPFAAWWKSFWIPCSPWSLVVIVSWGCNLSKWFYCSFAVGSNIWIWDLMSISPSTASWECVWVPCSPWSFIIIVTWGSDLSKTWWRGSTSAISSIHWEWYLVPSFKAAARWQCIIIPIHVTTPWNLFLCKWWWWWSSTYTIGSYIRVRNLIILFKLVTWL